MKNGVSSVVGFILLVAFVYVAWLEGFWVVMGTWDWNTWAIFVFGVLIAWVARNDV